MKEVLSGKKVIMNKELDWKYLKTLIRNKGIIKEAKNKQPKINIDDLNCINCTKFAKQLIEEGYNLETNKPHILFTLLVKENIFFKNHNNNYFIREKYLEDGYFIKGKSKNIDDGDKVYQILITDKGKQFIIDTLKLKK